jgi:hypothetical protein
MSDSPLEQYVVPKATVEIDSNGSAGKVKVKVRATGDTVAEAGRAARLEFVRQMAALEAQQEQSWIDTLDLLEARQ